MTPLRLVIRNLLYFRAASLAVVAGMIVATAALAGSLMVGDSVRGSLRQLAVRRLGPVDYALVANRFFSDSSSNGLAKRMADSSAAAGKIEVIPAVVASGTAAIGEGAERKTTGDVQIVGLADLAKVNAGTGIANSELVSVLGGIPKVDQASSTPISFTFPSKEDAPRESVVARRGVDETSASLRIPTSGITAPAGDNKDLLELFNLQGGQRTPRNAWVNLKDLQDAIQQPGRANVLLAHDKSADLSAASETLLANRSVEAVAALNAAVRQVVQLDDYGLAATTAKATGEWVLATKSTYLDPPIVTAALDVGKKLGVEPRLINVNLVNKVGPVDDKGEWIKDVPSLHYLIGAGISRLDDGPIAPDEIIFNEETAKQLNLKAGDRVRIDYFNRSADGDLTDANSVQKGLIFRVGRVIPTTGIGNDADLTPKFKGLTDVKSVSQWKPPPDLKARMDIKLAEKDNDAYWKKHGAAPRLFIHIDAAKKLWAGPYGDVTSLRVPADKKDAFAEALRQAIDPTSMGFLFQPIKLQQIQASSGSTDFSGLFVGFSFFLIAAASLLVAMLFRLNIEQRVRQFGVMSAVGFAPKKLRWIALSEGGLLAIVGGAIGVAVGVGYTWLMVYGLRTWWVGAIGTTELQLFITSTTLWIGFVSGFLVAMCAVLWAVWRIGKVSPARLMTGQLSDLPRGVGRTGAISRLVGIILGVGGLVFLGLCVAKIIKTPELALAGGAILLIAGLVYLSGVLRPRRHAAGKHDVRSVGMLGLRNANRHTARSVLSVGLIAFAAFTLITVASMQKDKAEDTGDKTGGAGGYRLIARAAVPILSELNTIAGRSQAGFREADAAIWTHVKFTQIRRRAGQDISCLNLTKATSPTILGVPPGFVARQAFYDPASEKVNPWSLLEQPINEGSSGDFIPVIADAETAAYILKLSIGDSLAITDQRGRKRELRLVATVNHSIFQSEMLMSEGNFRELFPAQSGAGTLLVECPPEQVQSVQQALNAELEPYAVSVDTTAALLESFQKIQNTYLATFRTLGSLGLALGTIGLAVVLVRNVIERRGELALLAALGFTPRSRVALVLSENVALLVLGLAVGTGCALMGIVPTLLTSKTNVNWGSLSLTMLGVLALGLLASVVAVKVGGVNATPKDIRRE